MPLMNMTTTKQADYWSVPRPVSQGYLSHLWACPCGPHGQMTMMVHMQRSTRGQDDSNELDFE